MIKVMIADDDINAREGIAGALDWEKLNAEVVCVASNGKQVVDALQNEKADLLILDINMPVMSGIDVARYVKENSPETQIVLLSAYAEFEYACDAVAVGIREYLLKPINYQKISQLSKIVSDVAEEFNITNTLAKGIHDTLLHDKVKVASQEKNITMFEEILTVPDNYKRVDIYRSYCMQIFQIVSSYFHFENHQTNVSLFKENLMNSKTVRDIHESSLNEIQKLITYKNDSTNKNEKLVQDIIFFVENNYQNPDLNVQSIGVKFGYVPDYLAKLFKNYSDISLKELIVECRLKKAVELLEKSELSVWKIAEYCGYKTNRGFIKNFKSKKGITPAEYRDNAARGDTE